MVEAQKISDVLYRIEVPTPLPVGPVNVYFIDAGEPAIIDTGARTDEAWRVLVEALKPLGRSPKDIRRIAVTHNHPDHVGMARRIVDASGARVHIHREDMPTAVQWHAAVTAKLDEYVAMARFWGMAVESTGLFKTYFDSLAPITEALAPASISPFEGARDEVRLGDATLEVLHCPGHTQGLVCFYWAKEKILFSGDHLLEDITPNPTLYVPAYRGKRSGLADYLESLKIVEPLDVGRILPGHGDPYTGLRERITEMRRHHDHRKEKVLEALKSGPRTVLEIVKVLWRKLKGGELYLALREAHGHLELLEEQGKVSRKMADGVAFYSLRT